MKLNPNQTWSEFKTILKQISISFALNLDYFFD